MTDQLNLAFRVEGSLCEVQVPVITTTFDHTNAMLSSHLQICTRIKLKGKSKNCEEGPNEMTRHKNAHTKKGEKHGFPLLSLSF